ncbi:MAG: hypothetical protein AMXMBFR26_09890 [Porticoccaceae bacterium]
MAAEWTTSDLGELTTNFDGRRKPVKESDRRPGPYPYYGASGVVDHVDGYLFDGEYLLIAEDGENLRTRQTPIAFMAKGKFWVNNHAHIVTGNDKADTRFLMYALQNADISGYLTGAVMPKLTQGNLNRIELTHPGLPEQRAIAHILGTLDDKIELNRRRNQTLEAMARALFKDWFVDFGPVRAKMQAREPYLPADLWQLFPDRLDDEGKPEGWVYLPVGEFAELKGGKQLEKEKIASSGPIPVFGGAGVMGYTDSHNADGFVIAVGRVGAYCGQFFSHRGKAWINNNASLIKQTDDDLAEWLFLSLSHADIDVIKKGAAQPFVSNGDIAKLPLMWPTEAMVNAFTDIVGPVREKKDQHDLESRTLSELRDTLLPKLISGELRIADAEKFMEKFQ